MKRFEFPNEGGEPIVILVGRFAWHVDGAWVPTSVGHALDAACLWSPDAKQARWTFIDALHHSCDINLEDVHQKVAPLIEWVRDNYICKRW